MNASVSLAAWWSNRSPRRRPAAFRPALEPLEGRVVPATVTVDAAASLHLIDPNIYGINSGSAATVSSLNVPFNRQGGNLASRYNWQQNASNHAQDFYFESLPEGPAVVNGVVDDFFSATRGAGAQASLTIPMLDYVAKLGPNRDKLASFSIAKYGPQTDNDAQFFPDAGNGISTAAGNPYIVGNDPTDANVANSVAFQTGAVQHLVGQFGTAGNGGVHFYALDNEPGLWHETHRDVHPTGASMDEVRDKLINYATMIKAQDPTALTLGPEEWGYAGYIYSGMDKQIGDATGDYSNLPDRTAHGGMDNLPYILDQIHQHDVASGTRLLDYLTVHYYPQSGEDGEDVSTAMQTLRNRSTRSLWDPSYVDVSYINDVVQLIPRLHNYVNTLYPGTKVGVTEYSWGAENHMNGATAEADVLGILGREGADLANYYSENPANTLGTGEVTAGTPVFNSFKMYRNYDGSGSTFGEMSVSAGVANPDLLSSFAARRSSDGALTIMIVNKTLYSAASPTTPVTVSLSNFAGTGVAQAWQLAAPDPNNMTVSAITQLANINYAGNSISLTVPDQSVTLLVLKPSLAPHGNPQELFVIGQTNQVYSQKLNAAGQSASAYSLAASMTVKSLVVGSNASNLTQTFVLGQDDRVYYQKFNASGTPATGYVLAAPGTVLSFAVGYDAAGRPELFAQGTDNRLYYAKFNAAGDPVSGYAVAAGGTIKSFDVGRRPNGFPEVFVIGTNDRVYGLKFDATGTPLGSYFLAAGGAVKSLNVGQDAAGHPEVFVLGQDSRAYGLKFDNNGNAVGGYFLVAPGTVKSLSLGTDAFGQTLLFAVGTDDRAYRVRFDVTGSPVTGYTLAATGRVAGLVVSHTTANTPELLAVGLDGQVYGLLLDDLGNSAGGYFLTRAGTVKALRATR